MLTRLWRRIGIGACREGLAEAGGWVWELIDNQAAPLCRPGPDAKPDLITLILRTGLRICRRPHRVPLGAEGEWCDFAACPACRAWACRRDVTRVFFLPRARQRTDHALPVDR